MTNPIIQIDDDIREMTNEELALHKIVQTAARDSKSDLVSKTEAKAAAQAKLTALGLTVEDLQALGL